MGRYFGDGGTIIGMDEGDVLVAELECIERIVFVINLGAVLA